MRLTAPEGFNHRDFYAGITMAQAWDIFPGHQIQGHKNVQHHLGEVGAPSSFDGMRVLEIAPWNGFFGFEIIRRGAKELVALGPDDPAETGFHKTTRLLEIKDRVTYIRDSVYNIKSHNLGKFDAIFCLGLIYHLRHPLLAFDVLHDHCTDQGLMYIDTVVVDSVAKVDNHIDDSLRQAWSRVSSLPISLLVRGDVDLPLSADTYNWFAPNASGLRAWVRSSGFAIEHEKLANDWMSMRLRRVERPFIDGLEGYNPGVQRTLT